MHGQYIKRALQKEVLACLKDFPAVAILDGFVKSPEAALRRILRRCGVPKSTPHSSGFARLACELFTKSSEIRLFTKASFLAQGNVVNPRWLAI